MQLWPGHYDYIMALICINCNFFLEIRRKNRVQPHVAIERYYTGLQCTGIATPSLSQSPTLAHPPTLVPVLSIYWSRTLQWSLLTTSGSINEDDDNSGRKWNLIHVRWRHKPILIFISSIRILNVFLKTIKYITFIFEFISMKI